MTLRALQAQINPHFLYNSLNTIKWMGQMQGADSIVDAVNALSSIMQVNMSKNTYLTFQEELDYLNKYVCMKEFQKAARIKFVCKIEEELRQCYILKMLIQPIVENSLKHGEVMEREDGYISISIYSDGEDVQIDVEDNGKGLSEEESRAILDNLRNGDVSFIATTSEPRACPFAFLERRTLAQRRSLPRKGRDAFPISFRGGLRFP